MKGLGTHNFRTLSMPLGMMLGALLCRPIEWLEAHTLGLLTPSFIFLILFFTFCRVDARKIRFSTMHLWLLLFQGVGSVVAYYALAWYDVVVAQGAMICVLAPVAMAAVVIGGMLGAKVETMAAYSLACNLFVSVVAPYLLHALGNGECSMWQILQRVAPLLILPFVAGQLARLSIEGLSGWVERNKEISFYLWLLSLMVIIGRTTCFVIDHSQIAPTTKLALAGVALIICLIQFKTGRSVGRRYGDAAAGGQSLGQKNTVMAVWLSQSFLDPVSSIAPTAYIVWQNLVNSYQLYRQSHNQS